MSDIEFRMNSLEGRVSRTEEQLSHQQAELISLRQGAALQDNNLARFWDREWPELMGLVKSLSLKLDTLMQQRLEDKGGDALQDQAIRTLEREMSEIKRINAKLMWKVAGLGAGSGGVIYATIELFGRLVSGG